MQPAELLQLLTFLGFVLLLALSVVIVAYQRDARRYYAMPVLVYALAGFVYYTAVVFFYDLTTADQRLMGSIVLRLLSIFMASAYLVIPLRGGRNR